MKDLRGISASAVRNAILKEFRLQIPSSRKKSNMVDILDWKKLGFQLVQFGISLGKTETEPN